MDLKAFSLKDELGNDEINELIEYIKPLMKSATNTITINKGNYIFYFSKLFTSRGIKIKNDVRAKKASANWTRFIGYAATAISFLLAIYSYMKPDPAVKTAARVATQTSHFIKRTGSLINSAWGNEEED